MWTQKNQGSKAVIKENEYIASGNFMNVKKGSYTGISEIECVAKSFKSGSVFKESYFQSNLKVIQTSLEIITLFNALQITDTQFWVNLPQIWTDQITKEKYLVEPFIPNFQKLISNTGWTSSNSFPLVNSAQALCHFSYHHSNRNLLLCDIQGGLYHNGFIISNPVIISLNKEFGPADLGKVGISNFFAHHKCNSFCNKDWLIPESSKQCFQVEEGTGMILLDQLQSLNINENNLESPLIQLSDLINDLKL